MTTITDTFTRANSTSTLGSTESPVLAWTADNGTWGINTNKAYVVTQAGFDSRATIPVGTANMDVSVAITTAQDAGVMASYVDSGNYYLAKIISSAVTVIRRQGGSDNTLTSGAGTWSDGATLRLVTNDSGSGTQVTAYIGATQVYTGLDTTSGRPAGTRAGLRDGTGGSPGSPRFDNLSVVYTVPVDTHPATNVWVEVAFTTDPDDPSPSWTDLTSRLDIAAGIDITRGRQDEYGAVTPGRCSLVLDNTDGELTAGRVASSFYPNVKPSRRMRVKYVDPNTAAVTYRFDGYVEEWPTEWPGGNKYTQTRITATDLLARIGTKRTLRSVVEETILLSNPAVYYPLGEPEGSTLAGDVTGSNDQVMAIVPVGAAGGTLTFGTGTGPGTDGIPAPMFAPASTTSGFHLEAINIPAVGGYNNVTLRASALTSTAVSQSAAMLVNDWGFYLELRYDATGHLVADYWNPWSGAFEFTITSASIYSDGLTHNPAVTLSQSGGTVTATLYDGGTSLGTASWSAGYLPLFPIMYAGGRRKDRLFTGTLSHVAAFNSALDATALGDQATSTSTGFAGERSDQRIARIASWANLPTARQVLDVGMSASVAWVDTTGKKPLDAMQQIADTEQGILFADTQGRLVFHSRVDSYSDPAVVASIDAHDVGRDVTPTMSKQGLVNDLVGKRTDGPDQHRTDDASITEHGWYSESIELAVTTDAEVLSAMQWILVTHAQPVERVPDLSIDAMTNTAIQAQVRALDIGSRLQVTSTPSQSHASTWDLTVQGYQESISESGWQVSVNTTNRAGILGWRVDDATFSQVDAGYQFVY